MVYSRFPFRLPTFRLRVLADLLNYFVVPFNTLVVRYLTSLQYVGQALLLHPATMAYLFRLRGIK